MCIPAVEVLERRLLVTLVAAAGISVQFLAVLVGGLDYLLLLRAQQPQRQALFVSGQNNVDFEDLRFNPRYSQIAGKLDSSAMSPPYPATPQPAGISRETNGTPLYDTMGPGAWSGSGALGLRLGASSEITALSPNVHVTAG